MSNDAELDPVQEGAVPLTHAIGRAVVSVAVLEKVLLAAVVTRDLGAQGTPRRHVSEEASNLRMRSAGALLRHVRGLGIDERLLDRAADVIARRNQVVHHLMEDLPVALALETGHEINDTVVRIDQLSADCQLVIDELALVAFANMEAAFGLTVSELAEQLTDMELEAAHEDTLREMLEFARTLRGALLWEPRLREERPENLRR
jgi:hypothetical protein